MDNDYNNGGYSNSAENNERGYVSGEYHFTGNQQRERSSQWSDPVINKVDDDHSSFYSPNYHYSAPEEKKPKKKKKSGGFLRAFCLVLVCVLLSAAASGAVTWLLMDHYGVLENGGKQVVIGNASQISDKTDTNTAPVQVTGDILSGSEIYTLGCEQAVGVTTTVVTENFFGQQTQNAVAGSGFIISEDGYIMTNYHVIEYAAAYDYELTVMTAAGEEHKATVVGYDMDNDIAVIKIEATGLSPVTFGNSDNIQVGEQVYAIGNPLGELSFSQTTGAISALDRVITTDVNSSINMFQFDAAVNSGNSGGPLYNSKGEVIGVVTAKYASTGVEGLGFAVPINDAVSIAQQIIENGYVTGKAYLGIFPEDIEEYVIRYYGIPEGAYVAGVTPGTCSDKAGIETGDIITAIDGSETRSVEELKAVLKTHSAGEEVELTVYRAGKEMKITVTLDEAPADTTITQEELEQMQKPQR